MIELDFLYHMPKYTKINSMWIKYPNAKGNKNTKEYITINNISRKYKQIY